jgi:predicted esterase
MEERLSLGHLYPKPLSMSKTILAIICVLSLAACGGGGGGGSSDTTPAPDPSASNSEPIPTVLELLDSVPAFAMTNLDPKQSTFSFAHLGYSDLRVNLSSDCTGFAGTTIRRTLLDLSNQDFDELLKHNVRCNLEENTSVTVEASGTRSNDASFVTELPLSSGVSNPLAFTVTEEFSLPKNTVNDMFLGYIGGALFDDLDLPFGIELLVRGIILDIADKNWANLTDPDALYDVTSQQVKYLSRHPDGAPSKELTAAITFPVTETSSSFVPRNRIIILTHATGSSPGDLNNTDAWYILANLFASRGYLVIAPDNYGRGGTKDSPETYLMGTRTALNSFDLVSHVLADTNYKDFYTRSDLTIIGYSQGGHSALGLYLALETNDDTNLTVKEVYSGGAPHNLYRTVRGVLQHLDGSCDGNDYCQFVDEETTVPFATDRIFPGFLNYANTGLSIDDVVIDDKINTEFINTFLEKDPVMDRFKALLQLSSYTQIISAEDILDTSAAVIHLYHSEFDRLVPSANTSELASTFENAVTIDFHKNKCNSQGYEAIFNLTDKVGVIHTLCGLSMLDETLANFK